jgi:hypothetical protein
MAARSPRRVKGLASSTAASRERTRHSVVAARDAACRYPNGGTFALFLDIFDRRAVQSHADAYGFDDNAVNVVDVAVLAEEV